jgi:oxygen-independent coproporphyrinogen-3 oxidase
VTAEALISSHLAGKYGGFPSVDPCWPAAARFALHANQLGYREKLRQKPVGGLARPLALYLHVPAAENPEACALADLALRREINLLAKALGGQPRSVAKLRCVAGRANPARLEALLACTSLGFQGVAHADLGVEMEAGAINLAPAQLSALGFSRWMITARAGELDELAAWLREMPGRDHKAIGLKLLADEAQTTASEINDKSWLRALDAVLACKPDYLDVSRHPGFQSGYAHAWALERLQLDAYQELGHGCFAREDSLFSQAQQIGKLSWEMGGYDLVAGCDVIGIGPGARTRIGNMLFCNASLEEGYTERVQAGQLPVVRSFRASPDQLARWAIMESLLCQAEVSMDMVGAAFQTDWKVYFANELEQLEEFERDGLIQWDDDWLMLTPLGKLFADAVLRVFAAGNE